MQPQVLAPAFSATAPMAAPLSGIRIERLFLTAGIGSCSMLGNNVKIAGRFGSQGFRPVPDIRRNNFCADA
ncbi:MAG TPA: hypothetical protein VKF42_03585 [Chitinivibrionales bacterium]|jgi:hypothetical protein|nr:hypothetical protein [Chitinivibrionales bacterium]